MMNGSSGSKGMWFWCRSRVLLCMVLVCVGLQSRRTEAFRSYPSVTKPSLFKSQMKVPNYAQQSFSWKERSNYNPKSYQMTMLGSSTSPDSHEELKVARRYRVASILYFITFASLWVSPNRMIDATMSLGTKIGGSCGYAIASGVCNVLQSDHSEGFQKCNLGLIWFAFVGLFAFPGEAYFHSSLPGALRLSLLMTTSKLYGLYASILGFKHSNQMALWKQNIQKTWTGFCQLKHKSATMYRNQLYAILLFGVINHSFEAMHSIQVSQINTKFKSSLSYKQNSLTPFLCLLCVVYQRGQTPFFISLSISAVARLGLISSMVYSLKEASEQQRLTELPFIKFNLLLSAWTVAGTYVLYFHYFITLTHPIISSSHKLTNILYQIL